MDDALIEACQAAQQGLFRVSGNRDVVARQIVDFMKSHPEMTRAQIVWHVGQIPPPST